MPFLFKTLMRKVILLFVIVFVFPLIATAQRWKTIRYEVNYGLGASNFLGDLGGADQVGTHYFKDLNFNETGYVAHLALRYKLTEYYSVKGSLFLANVSGDDKNSKEQFRMNRNLSFYSNIIELSTQVEASWMKEKLGHRYKLRGIKGSKSIEVYTYFFVGLGVFYFNPQAELDGNYYELQPLGTEGQGHLRSREKYSRIQLAIPLGIGFKRSFGSRWGINLEYGIRKTFTDYIDDVSTTYVQNSLLARSPQGEITVNLANRSPAKDNPADPMYGSTVANQQRGDSRYTDSYMFAVLSLTYKIKNGRGNLPKF